MESISWATGKTAEQLAEFYHDEVLPLIDAYDPNAQLIIGGSSAHTCGVEWITRFVEHYRLLYGEEPPRAGWHFHIYPDVIPFSAFEGSSCRSEPES